MNAKQLKQISTKQRIGIILIIIGLTITAFSYNSYANSFQKVISTSNLDFFASGAIIKDIGSMIVGSVLFGIGVTWAYSTKKTSAQGDINERKKLDQEE